jgi:hypothetical protein
MFRLRAYSAPLNMTAHFAILWDEVGGKAANLILFLVMPLVMSTKGACARMETSAPNTD